MSSEFHKKIQGVIEVGSLPCIEAELDQFTYRGQKYGKTNLASSNCNVSGFVSATHSSTLGRRKC